MKMIPYGRQCIDKADILETIKVLRSDWLTQGPKVAEFENALKKYCGAKYAVAVSSGTAALHVACLAVGLKKGDEVITTPMTFAATANSILYTGARPVFADIELNTGNIDTQEIIKKINNKTKAILPVHFAGLPCDMEKISRIAKKAGLIIIEDACHALGAEYKYKDRWIKVGSCKHSDMAIFSFHPVKSITTGEGGAVLTNRKDLYDKLVMLRNHGITKDDKKFSYRRTLREAWYYEMQCLGFNYRITDFQCALGLSQLKKINKFIARRREIARIYDNAFSGVDEIELPYYKDRERSAWHIYSIRIKDRKIKAEKAQFFNMLKENHISAQAHYIPVYFHPYYGKLGYKKGICPNAEKYYYETISIPLFSSMDNKEVRYSIDTIKMVFKKIKKL